MRGVSFYVVDADPTAARHHRRMVAAGALSDWQRASAGLILVRPEQPDPAWRKMERLLLRHGWLPNQPLTYRQLQALAGWCTDLVLDWNKPPAQQAGGGGQTAQSEGQSPNAAHQPQSRAATPRQGRQPRQRTTTPVRLWHPWPQPSQARIARASAMLSLIQEELAEDARESIAVGWRQGRLAVRQEMGQLDPARNWERLTLPRLLLALDFSGSMGGFVAEVAALGATLAHVFPWLVVAAAPNAALEPLITVGDKQIIADGAWYSLPEGLPPEQENNADQWRMIDRIWPVRAAIYVGDWEGWRMADAFPGRFGGLSVYQARYGAPVRTDHAYGEPTPWPTVIRCNTADDFIAALPVLLRVLLEGA